LQRSGRNLSPNKASDFCGVRLSALCTPSGKHAPGQFSRAFPKHSPLGSSSSLSLCSELVLASSLISQGNKKPHEYSVEGKHLIFLYISTECCVHFKKLLFFLFFINERKMLSDSLLKGRKSTALQINCLLSAVYAMSYFCQQSYQHCKILV